MRVIFEVYKTDNGRILHNVEENKSLFCGERVEVLTKALNLWLTYYYSKAAIYVKDENLKRR
ncbi:MAG: hypothetical protein ACTSPV_00540 [Candidatus Hodarchaeales archaeon]